MVTIDVHHTYLSVNFHTPSDELSVHSPSLFSREISPAAALGCELHRARFGKGNVSAETCLLIEPSLEMSSVATGRRY